MKFFYLLPIFINLFFFNVHAQSDSRAAGFPKEVSFEQGGKTYNLALTGVSTRKKFFVKVYNVASYLQTSAMNRGDLIGEILNDRNAKQLTIKWVHDASIDQVRNGYRESFDKVLGMSENEQLPQIVDQYISFFNHEANVGDQHVIRWLPGGYVEVLINGSKAGSVKDPEFAKELWNIWFGSKSVVNRDELVSEAR